MCNEAAMQQGKRVAHLAQPGEFQHYLPVDIHYYQSIHTEMHPPITVVSSAHNVFTTKHTLLSLGIRGSQGCHPRTIYLLDIHYYHSIHTEMHPPITVVSSAHNVFTTKHTLLSLGIRGSQGCHPRTIYLLDIHYYHSIHTEMHPLITVVSSAHNISTRHTLLPLDPY